MDEIREEDGGDGCQSKEYRGSRWKLGERIGIRSVRRSREGKVGQWVGSGFQTDMCFVVLYYYARPVNCSVHSGFISPYLP